MKSKPGKFLKKQGEKMTEAEREEALIALIVRIIVAQTLKEFYGKNKDSERDCEKSVEQLFYSNVIH